MGMILAAHDPCEERLPRRDLTTANPLRSIQLSTLSHLQSHSHLPLSWANLASCLPQICAITSGYGCGRWPLSLGGGGCQLSSVLTSKDLVEGLRVDVSLGPVPLVSSLSKS